MARMTKVVKRDGTLEDVSFDKISLRIQNLSSDLNIDPILVAQRVVQGVYDGVKTSELDHLASETAAHMSTVHPDYESLAARIAMSNLHKETSDNFLKVVNQLNKYVNPKTGAHSPLVSDELLRLVEINVDLINSKINYALDFTYTYFSIKTLTKSYLFKIDGKTVERPQHMLMRIALGVHGSDLSSAFETYRLMSLKYFTHASPTMFNAGTPKPQCSSCFLLSTEDSIDGIYETLARSAKLSKFAGGVGINVSNIRATNSYIAGTSGHSNGLTPMLRVFNATARYVDQGGGKRKGAFAIYLEPWHADIFEVLELKKNTGPDELRARDLFYALWVPDLFMKRVEQDGDWSLMCPNECPGLYDCHSEKFEALYVRYEQEGRARRTIKAQDLWFNIIESQIETGTPYLMFKDACNKKSNQSHLGTIRGSNLCTEIVQYTSFDEVAVCNLASVSLGMFVDVETRSYNFQELFAVVCHMTRNLNKIIDLNYYPLEQARNSNMRHRPIGIGVQGLQDAFFKMRYPFDSKDAALLNRDIFETIYYAAVYTSNRLAVEQGPYESFAGSPASKGILQFDMWNASPSSRLGYDWNTLKQRVIQQGLRNSLLVAPMPTASTAQILGNVECFEPQSSNIYSRTVLAGTFNLVNEYLINDLIKLNLWTPEMKNEIISRNGSIQDIASIPLEIRELYKTVWEIKQRVIVDMAADRGAFIDQSQSLNIHITAPDFAKMTSLHFHAWKSGLKTGQYYLRTRPAADPIKFTVEKAARKSATSVPLSTGPSTTQFIEQVGEVCTMQDGCLSCGS